MSPFSRSIVVRRRRAPGEKLAAVACSLLAVCVLASSTAGVASAATGQTGVEDGADETGFEETGADETGVEETEAPPPDALAAADPTSVPLQLLIPEPGLLHPSLVEGLRIDTTRTGGSAGPLRTALVDRFDATDRYEAAIGEQTWATQRIRTLDFQLIGAREDLVEADAARVEAASNLSDFAVASFVGFEEVETSSLAPDGDELGQRTLTAASEDYLTGVAADAVARHDRAQSFVDGLESDRVQRERDLDAAIADAEVAETDRLDAVARIESGAPAFERELLASSYLGTDIPYVVLNAYVTAASITAIEDPTCRVSWHHLAGIGKVESRHGSFGGNTVGADGRTDGEILGPVLDGDPWLAIPDSDGGVYDGNIEWDRAVGPMQFIPTSWAIFGRDGNGDGETDPHNLYDAALAAAGHLCRRNAGLDEEPSFRQALLGYNRSAAYGSDVIRISGEYLEQIDLPPTFESEL